MFDDLDDLLDDAPQPKRTTTTAQAKPAAKKTSILQKDEDEFDWEKPASSSLAFGQSKRATQAQPVTAKVDSYKKQESAQTFGQKKKADEWGDWGEENEKSGIFGKASASGLRDSQPVKDRDDGRSSMGSNYAGFGILGR